MNIEQMLRDAIERKTAKILKEEYGIEMSKDVEGVIPQTQLRSMSTKLY